ncbi:MAG: hypothetical protein ACRYFK_21070 [Janthinobacterium lividum]
MTFYAFRLLSPVGQLYWVLKHGELRAQRVAEGRGINLYHCADEGRGFFVEVGTDEADERFVVLRSFVNSGPLEAYAHYVRLPAF